MVPVPIAGANCENEGPKAPEWLILVPGRAGVCGGVGCNPGRRGVRGTPATSSAVATLCCYAVVATLWLLHCGCYAVGATLWLLRCGCYALLLRSVATLCCVATLRRSGVQLWGGGAFGKNPASGGFHGTSCLPSKRPSLDSPTCTSDQQKSNITIRKLHMRFLRLSSDCGLPGSLRLSSAGCSHALVGSLTPDLPGSPALVGSAAPGLPGSPALVGSAAPRLPGSRALVGSASPGLPGSPALVGSLAPGLPGSRLLVGSASPGLPGSPALVGSLAPGLPGSRLLVGSLAPGLPGSPALVDSLAPGLPGSPALVKSLASRRWRSQGRRRLRLAAPAELCLTH